MTQTELAEKAGVTQGTISMIETGGRTPSLPVMVRIAEALSCSVDYLLNDGQE